jgi:hypothetical protein
MEPEDTSSYSQRLAIILSQNDWKQTHILTTIYLYYFSIFSRNIRVNFHVVLSLDFVVSDILTCNFWQTAQFLISCTQNIFEKYIPFSFNNSNSSGCFLYHQVEELYDNLFRLLHQKDFQIDGLQELGPAYVSLWRLCTHIGLVFTIDTFETDRQVHHSVCAGV